jgi:hypothetical protein
MKKIRLNIGLAGRLAIMAVLLFAGSTLFSFVVADRLAEDIWKRLGINRQECTEKISQSFINGYLHYAGVSNVKNLAMNDRAAVAKDLATFARQYLSSPTFKAEYDKARASYRPVEPKNNSKTKEQIRQEQVDQLQKSIKSMEDVAKTAPADQKKSYESSINDFKKMMKEYQDPNNQMIEMMYQQSTGTYQGDVEEYKKDLKKWEATFPADCKQFVRARLQHYLDLGRTVDFSAALVERGGLKRFVNPAYQSKNGEWKMIYRAGKDVYEQTKAFIDQWMKDM